MRNVFFCAASMTILANCGGSTTSTVDSFQVIKQFSDGSGVARVEANVDGENYDFVVKVPTVNTGSADDLPSFDLTNASTSDFVINGLTVGRSYVPPPTNEQNALRSYLETLNGEAGVFQAGSTGEILGTGGLAFGTLPKGTASITGFAVFLDGPTSFGGLFELSVDFDSETASLEAGAPGYTFNADTMVIAKSSGTFGTDSALVSRIGEDPMSASFVGQLHGDATAASGLGYDNGASPTISIAIAGERATPG